MGEPKAPSRPLLGKTCGAAITAASTPHGIGTSSLLQEARGTGRSGIDRPCAGRRYDCNHLALPLLGERYRRLEKMKLVVAIDEAGEAVRASEVETGPLGELRGGRPLFAPALARLLLLVTLVALSEFHGARILPAAN
jgi:hypothetical protein